MYRGNDRHYFEIGREALELIQEALTFEPTTILDMPCGYGRVLRWLRAAYPAASITACDIVRAGVDFCAATFDAVPVYSSNEPDEVQIGDVFDLIWVGSFFTHLDLDRWPEFMRYFASLLSPDGGRLLFTTAGAAVVERTRVRERLGVAKAHEKEIVADFDRNGIGFSEHRPGSEWGLTRASENWVREVVDGTSLTVLSYQPHGWGKRQDVFVAAHS